jgi:hypothetical protein
MSCEAYIILLDEYLNNELEAELRGSVSAHLGTCRACQEESRLLKIESNFYQKAAVHDDSDFSRDWETMRGRLATSLLEERIQPPLATPAAQFFALFRALFSARKPVFGAFLLIAFGALTLFFINAGDNDAANESANASVKEIDDQRSESEVLPTDNRIIQKEPEPARELVMNDPPEALAGKSTPAARTGRRNRGLTLGAKRFETVGSRVARTKEATKPVKSTFNLVGSRPGAENDGPEVQFVADDRNLANYLNKVHLFLLMFRNLENDQTINAVIGDKYQTEARMFLQRGSDYKQTMRRSGNIPAVELLNEIEPLLRTISDLDEQNGNDQIRAVSAMVRQTGIVFKIRLWMSNARAERSSQVRGGEKR